MRLLFAICAFAALSSAAHSASWTQSLDDGIKQASVRYGENTEILVLCDVGVNAPITSISFMIDGTAPLPNSSVRLKFDKEEPIFAQMDVEGGLGSSTAASAATFRTILRKLKSKSKVSVRLFDGSEHVFALRGSTGAIGDCTPDHDRYALASN